MEKVLWYIIAGTRGGINRARIIHTIQDRPYNAHQLAEQLSLDYKTVTHHLKVLKKNQLLTTEGDGYGSMYFLSPALEEHYETFLKVWDRIQPTNHETEPEEK